MADFISNIAKLGFSYRDEHGEYQYDNALFLCDSDHSDKPESSFISNKQENFKLQLYISEKNFLNGSLRFTFLKKTN
jgi:hypothetical protein